MLQGRSHVSVGHCTEGLLIQPPTAAGQASQVCDAGSDSSSETTAVGAELEPAVYFNAEDDQRVAGQHRLPRNLNGASDGVSGVLR